MSDEIFLSNTISTPMYSQIMDQIIARIMAGDWPPGHPLPSTRALASSSKVSVITVKRAYLELEHAGVIITRQGKGSFVAENLDLPQKLVLDEFNAHLDGMLDAAAKLGMETDEIVDRVQEKLPALTTSRKR